MAAKPCKKCKKKSVEAELEIAETAFREALKGGDSFADALLYSQLQVDSAQLTSPAHH